MFRFVTRFIARSRLAAQIAREREELSKLDPRILRDLGIDALAAQQESTRGYWDLPKERQHSLAAQAAVQPPVRAAAPAVKATEVRARPQRREVPVSGQLGEYAPACAA